MKPVCLKECSTCDKLPIDHTLRELHDHYGYEYLTGYLINRTTNENKSMMNKIKAYATIIEHGKIIEQSKSMDFKIKYQQRINALEIAILKNKEKIRH